MTNIVLSVALLVGPVLPVPTIYATNGGWSVTYNDTNVASSFIWYLQYTDNINSPFVYCPDARYTNGVLSSFTERPNHFYRLAGVLNQ